MLKKNLPTIVIVVVAVLLIILVVVVSQDRIKKIEIKAAPAKIN